MTKVLAREGMQVTGVSDPAAVATSLADSKNVSTWLSLTCGCRCSVDAGFWRLPVSCRNCRLLSSRHLADSEVEAQTLRLGAFAFLKKPVTAAQLIEVVKRAFARSPLREA